MAGRTKSFLVLALVLPIFAVAPLFYPGYFQTHTGLVPLWNVSDLRANLGDLGWRPHVAIAFDPVRSDGLLPYYLAGILPLSPVAAVKLVVGLGWLLGSIGMFLWLKDWLGHPGALVAAQIYTYLPYQIGTVYVRGAWGEALFGGMLPWAFLVATSLAGNLPPRGWRLAYLPAVVFLWLGLGLSQPGLTIWAFIFVTLYLLVVHRPRPYLAATTASVGLVAAGALTLSVAVPRSAAPVTFADHFLYPFQLVSAYWGFGPSRLGWDDGLSFQLGLAAVGLSIVTVILWQRQGVQQTPVGRTDRRLAFFLGAAIIFTLLQFSPAAVVWNLPIVSGYSLSSSLTYPWQLLGLTGLCLAVLAGAALWLDKQLSQLPLFGAIIILIGLGSYNYLSPRFIQLDKYDYERPEAQLGPAQVTLVEHNFSVLTNGNTAGLNRGQTTIPLAVHGPLQANDILITGVIWHPLQTFTEDLKVFVHLVDANDRVIAQFDGQPQSGDYPTSQWIPGALIEDSYPLLVPADAPPGPYRLFIGLYSETTMARLPVATEAEGRVILNVE